MPRNKFVYVINLHIGAFKKHGKRCYVLWNNKTPRVCARTCNGSRANGKLIGAMTTTLVAVGIAIGIAVLIAILTVGYSMVAL